MKPARYLTAQNVGFAAPSALLVAALGFAYARPKSLPAAVSVMAVCMAVIIVWVLTRKRYSASVYADTNGYYKPENHHIPLPMYAGKTYTGVDGFVTGSIPKNHFYKVSNGAAVYVDKDGNPHALGLNLNGGYVNAQNLPIEDVPEWSYLIKLGNSQRSINRKNQQKTAI
jgi:hypothetical protein